MAEKDIHSTDERPHMSKGSSGLRLGLPIKPLFIKIFGEYVKDILKI